MPMKNLNRTGLVLAAVLAVFAGSVTVAGAVTERVKNSCSNDYYKFCPAYAVGSPALRQCMRSAGRKLSPKCINALVDAGEIKRPR
jgi:hypothetical protein